MLSLSGRLLARTVTKLPQVCRLLGYLIFFWSNENNEPRLEHNKSRIPAKDLNRIMQWLAANKTLVEMKWNEHFK